MQAASDAAERRAARELVVGLLDGARSRNAKNVSALVRSTGWMTPHFTR